MCRSGSGTRTLPPSEMSWNHQFFWSRFNQTSKMNLQETATCTHLEINIGLCGCGHWGMMGERERPRQSSSWVLTLSPAGVGAEALRVVDAWLTDTGLTVSVANRWKITIQLECDESELRAIPRISTLTVRDWWAEAGCPHSPPRVVDITFYPTLRF